MSLRNKTYKFRIYPTKVQQQRLAVEFGHARKVWNLALEMRDKAYKRRGESLNYVALSKHITQLKKTRRYAYLADATANCLVQKLIDLDKSYKNFFDKRASFPKFKRRDSQQSIRYQLDQRQIVRTFNNTPGSEKLTLTKLGPLKVKWSRQVKGVPKMATVTKTATGKYFVSLSVQEEISALSLTDKSVGIDLGLTHAFIESDGHKTDILQVYRRNQLKLAKAQRVLSRRKKGSNRRAKAKHRVALLHEKITNIRKTFLHHHTTRLIRDNQVICLEDLHVKGMVRNKHLSKSLSDAAMGELRRQIDYKAQWYGRTMIVVNRWYPSSKTCSGCDTVSGKLSLSQRSWTCSECHAVHDRDINAATNILNQGLKQYHGEHGNWPLGFRPAANEQGVSRAA